jgi:coenzyme F420-dependent glucose-6-phosphate dehydrogenase
MMRGESYAYWISRFPRTISSKRVAQVCADYTQPERPPSIIGAANTPQTAEWVARWVDGLITISRSREELQKLIEAFRRGGGEGKPMYLQVKLSYSRDDETARQGAYEQWHTNVLQNNMLEELRTPQEFEQAAQAVPSADLDKQVRISADLTQHIEWLREDLDMGFTHLYLHNVNREQATFIEAFGKAVLPALD